MSYTLDQVIDKLNEFKALTGTGETKVLVDWPGLGPVDVSELMLEYDDSGDDDKPEHELPDFENIPDAIKTVFIFMNEKG